MKMNYSRKKVNLNDQLVQVLSLSDVRLPNGKRRMKQPLWIEGEDSEIHSGPVYSFDFISAETDVKHLKKLIADGVVYTLERYVVEPAHPADNN